MGSVLKTEEYSSVDIFKFFCAILVVAIHTKPFENIFWLDAAIGILTRFAVPYFFVSSTYFLFMKLRVTQNPSKEYRHYFLRLFRFYVIWYVIFQIVFALRGEIRTPIYYIKQFFFCTNGSPLWFLSALLWAATLTFILSRFCKKQVLVGIAIVCFLIGYLFSTLRVLFVGNRIFDSINGTFIAFVGTQNGLFFAFPYTVLGKLLSEKRIIPQKNYYCCGILCSLILLMVESYWAVIKIGADLTFLWISAIPLTYFTMQLTLTTSPKLNMDFYYIRKSSTMLYVIHVLLMRPVQDIVSWLEISDTQNLVYFIMTLLLATLCALIIVKMLKRYSVLKYIM